MRNLYALIFLILLPRILTAQSHTDAIAVVVSDSSSLSDLSLTKLKNLYLGKISEYSDNQPVVLVEFEPLAEGFYNSVANMTLHQFRKHWMKLVFSGSNAAPPAKCREVENIKKILCSDSNAVCFIRYSEVKDCMKVVKIDGKSPLDKDYPLQEARPSK